MSGLEAIGIAASIIQVAELGTKLAVKLCTFYHQVKESNEAIQSLSSDVSLTCSILRQLGDSLNEDEETRLYSANAFLTAQEVLSECRKVFDKLDHAVEEQKRDNTKNRVARVTRKFGLALMERDLDVMRTNLERLKSTVLLMLNVIIYAGQIRCKYESPLLKEQRELINLLVAEKKANEDKYTNLQKAIESAQVNNHFPTLTPSTSCDTASTTSTAYDPSTEVKEYYTLVKNLLERVDACKYTFEPNRHRRIRSGIMDVHLAEEKLFQSFDAQKLQQLVREDRLFESLAMHAPAGANKKRKARPSFVHTGYHGQMSINLDELIPMIPSFGSSDISDSAEESSGQTPQALDIPREPRMFAPYAHRRSRTDDDEPLLWWNPRDRENCDSLSHSVDDASNIVEDFVLEWTTIDKGELPG